MIPDLLDDPTRLDDEKSKGRIATVLTNGGLPRTVCETPGETVGEQVERIKYEMEELYPDCTFEVIEENA